MGGVRIQDLLECRGVFEPEKASHLQNVSGFEIAQSGKLTSAASWARPSCGHLTEDGTLMFGEIAIFFRGVSCDEDGCF